MKQVQRFTVMRGWKLVLSDIGINPADVLRLAQLPQDLFVRKDASLSASEYFDLWRALEQAAGREALPLKIGQAISAEAFDPPLFAALCSPDLNTALRRLSDYKKLIGPLTLKLEVGTDYSEACMDCYGHNGAVPRSLGATELVFLTQLARLATRQKIVPLLLELPQLPDELGPYLEFFGRPLQQGSQVRIRFTAEDARLPFLTEDHAMWEFFAESLQQRLSALDYGAGISAHVRSALLEMLPGGQSAIEEVARRLALSKRSLQRHLSADHISYQDILNNTRNELARHYLQHSSLSPGEISYLLGFQDGNSFIRAFKTWTGSTPGEFRANCQAPA